MSWGIKISLLITGFVCFIGFMVYKSINQHIELVNEDYYANELAFQDQLDKMNNYAGLEEKLQFRIVSGNVEILYPYCRKINGEIIFFRPSDSALDRRVKVEPGKDCLQTIPLSSFRKGLYKVQVDWNNEQSSYFTEQALMIP